MNHIIADINASRKIGNSSIHGDSQNITMENNFYDREQMHEYPDAFINDIRMVVISKANDEQFKIFIPTFSIICVLMCLGVPGNCLALVVYSKRLKKAIARQFILTLATCDLLTCLIVMPLELGIMTHFFQWDLAGLCKSFRGFAYMINNVSSLTLLTIAAERYRLVCQPWKQKFTQRISKFICFINIGIALVTALPMVFLYGTQTIPLSTSLNTTKKELTMYKRSDKEKFEVNTSFLNNSEIMKFKSGKVVYGKSCMMDDSIKESAFPFYVVSIYIVSIIIMFLVLIILYGRVISTLSSRRKESLSQQEEKQKLSSAMRIRKITFMMVLLTVLYELCYLPCLTIVCLRLVRPHYYATLSQSGKTVFQLLLKSYLLCSALNPFVYCFCNKEFQAGLLWVFRSILPQRKLERSTLQSQKLDTVSNTHQSDKLLNNGATRTIDTIDLD